MVLWDVHVYSCLPRLPRLNPFLKSEVTAVLGLISYFHSAAE